MRMNKYCFFTIVIGLTSFDLFSMIQSVSWENGVTSCPRASQIIFKPTSGTAIIEAPAQAYNVMQKVNQSFIDILKFQSVPTALSQIVCRTEHPIILVVAGEGMTLACTAYQNMSEIPNEFMSQVISAQKANALPIADSVLSGAGFGLGAVSTQQLIRASSNKLATAALLGLVSGVGFYATLSNDLSLISPVLQQNIAAVQSTLMGIGIAVAQSLPTVINDFLRTSQKQKDITNTARQAVTKNVPKEVKSYANRVKATLSQITTALGKVTLVAVAVGTTAYAASQDNEDFVSDQTKQTFAAALGTTLGLVGATVAYEYAYRITAQATSVVTESVGKALKSQCTDVPYAKSGSYDWNSCINYIKSFNPFGTQK